MNLLLVEPGEVGADGVALLSGARAEHVRHVLRAQPGQGVRIGAVDGGHGIGTVLSLDEQAIALRCTIDDMTPPRPPVDLLLALPRPKVLRRLWAQLAALGVGRIILTNAERVERNYFDTHLLDVDVYRPLLIEGLQQARDTRLPVVTIHRRLKVLVEDDLDRLCPNVVRLVADPGAATTFATALGDGVSAAAMVGAGESARYPPVASEAPDTVAVAEPKGDVPRALLAVGPEGGWTEFELRLLQAHGFGAVGMGRRTLRSDTACVALLALLHEALR